MTITMSTEQQPPIIAVACGIPVDYEITKSPLTPLTGPDLTVHDASGNLVYKIDGRCCAAASSSSSSSSCGRGRTKSLCDAAGSPLVSFLLRNGEWRAFKGNSLEQKDIIFTVRKASASASKVELDVYLQDGNIDDPKPSFRLKGNPFRRSCTILREDTIVAQACLLYKLRKFVYWRHKFRLTVYPGNDHVLVIAMLVTFFGDYFLQLALQLLKPKNQSSASTSKSLTNSMNKTNMQEELLPAFAYFPKENFVIYSSPFRLDELGLVEKLGT